MILGIAPTIRRLVRETGISEDFLLDAAETYEALAYAEGADDIADYVARGLENEAQNYVDFLEHNRT